MFSWNNCACVLLFSCIQDSTSVVVVKISLSLFKGFIDFILHRIFRSRLIQTLKLKHYIDKCEEKKSLTTSSFWQCKTLRSFTTTIKEFECILLCYCILHTGFYTYFFLHVCLAIHFHFYINFLLFLFCFIMCI